MPPEGPRKSNAKHLESMDTSHYSTRARYHFLHNASNYVTMTIPLAIAYKSHTRGDMSFSAIVAIDETLDKFLGDLKKMLDTNTTVLDLKLWMRDAWNLHSFNKRIEKPVTAENINPLFRFCVGMGFGEYTLEVNRGTPKKQTPNPVMHSYLPGHGHHNRGVYNPRAQRMV